MGWVVLIGQTPAVWDLSVGPVLDFDFAVIAGSAPPSVGTVLDFNGHTLGPNPANPLRYSFLLLLCGPAVAETTVLP